MRLGVIGTGYVGLVAGAGFADFGNDVTCVDIDEARIAGLRRGELPIHEPHLPELVQKNISAGRLSFTTDFAQAIPEAEVVFLCVGTPPGPDGSADLSQVLGAARAIGPLLSGELTVIVLKSTVPVGTAERVRDELRKLTTQRFAVVSNPEFLKEGSAVEDFLRPMRVIVGIGPQSGAETDPAAAEATDEKARTVLRHLYAPVVRTNDRLLFTDSRSSELCKYASNAYLAMRVSFINDMANLCEQVGADVEMVRRGMGMDSRIGPSFLFPGIGYGGSCFPKDTQALLHLAKSHGIALPLIAATEEINQRQRLSLLGKMRAHFARRETPDGRVDALSGKVIAVWGLSFKPETDDVREAPALALIEGLVAAGAVVRATDPVAIARTKEALGPRAASITFAADAYETARGADALCLCTEWRQYRQPDWKRLAKLVAGRTVFDGRNIWDRDELRARGFTYVGVGRRTAQSS